MCNSCGLTAQESSFQGQEDLSKLFANKMNFSNTQESLQNQQPQDAPIAYSVSQHYHHSAHITSGDSHEDNSQSTLPTSVSSTQDKTEELLSRRGIDPSSLLPSQILLFQLAAPDQQSRLVELWRISPPEYTHYGKEELGDQLGSWQHTTLEQEEEMARLRYERNAVHSNTKAAEEEMSQASVGQENKPAFIEGDHLAMEPYIKSGYEILAERDYNHQAATGSNMGDKLLLSGPGCENHYNQAVDPAFHSKGWWEVYSEQPMEHQYGMFDQMNHFRATTQTAGGSYGQEDEEML
ncbi:hypothetical protein MMC18_000696 [Xylographa bjoerkii]|nr:hypothetical protein [Xylographa bjoerkii]